MGGYVSKAFPFVLGPCVFLLGDLDGGRESGGEEVGAGTLLSPLAAPHPPRTAADDTARLEKRS